MEVVAIVIWYSTGFAGAAVLVRLGHTRTVMWIGAALGGGLVVLPAVVAALRRSRSVRRHAWAAAGDDVARVSSSSVVLVVLDNDDDGAVADAAVRLRLPGEVVVIIGRVGHEASSPWLDTGEKRRVVRQLEFTARRVQHPCRTVVSSGSLTGVVRDAADGLDVRLLVASSDGPGLLRRADLEHVAADLGCPVLLVPDRTSASRPEWTVSA